MIVEIQRLLNQTARQPFVPPADQELCWSIVNDHLRDLGLTPVGAVGWKELLAKHPHYAFYAVWLAYLAGETDLGLTASRDPRSPNGKGIIKLAQFFAQLTAVTPEALTGNVLRQEEFLRKWLAQVSIEIQGESRPQSRERLEKLDSVRLQKILDQQARERDKKLKEWREAMARAEAERRSSYE